jgi:hypothetical protein
LVNFTTIIKVEAEKQEPTSAREICKKTKRKEVRGKHVLEQINRMPA